MLLEDISKNLAIDIYGIELDNQLYNVYTRGTSSPNTHMPNNAQKNMQVSRPTDFEQDTRQQQRRQELIFGTSDYLKTFLKERVSLRPVSDYLK